VYMIKNIKVENHVNSVTMSQIIETTKTFSTAECIDYATGAVVSRTIIKKNTGNVTLFAFDKGEGLSEHTAPFDAMVQVLDGSVEVTIGGTPYILQAGQSIIMPASIPHALKAVEKFKMMLIMIKS
jgi:quercetin dioxygenase-like cupin family protein